VESPCNPLVEDYTDVFYMNHKGDVPSVQCEMSLRRSNSMRDVDSSSFIFINFNVPAIEPRLSLIETTLQLPENITLFVSVAYIPVSLAKRSR
jgi:hypothetical protein